MRGHCCPHRPSYSGGMCFITAPLKLVKCERQSLSLSLSLQIWVAASNGATENASVVRHEDALIYSVVARKQACL